MWMRLFGAGAAVASLVAGVSACEVSQVDWANRSYVVSPACAPAPAMTAGTVTLHNGNGTRLGTSASGGTRVTLAAVYEGDITRDGVQDAAVLLNCHDTIGGNNNSSEIQVFTRDAKPVQRLLAPRKHPGGTFFAPYFVYDQIQIHDGALYTGVDSYLPGDPHARPSAHDVYRWDWNGNGFTPVDLVSTVVLKGAELTLPAGWVIEAATPANAHSHPIAPTWCLMPHSRSVPTDADAPGCTIAFRIIPTSVQLSPDTPGGLVGNPEFCDPRQPQAVSLLTQANADLGGRRAAYRVWRYSCLDGTRRTVEQYVTSAAPGYVLYSSQATSTVHSGMTQIARTAQLPKPTG